MSTGFPCDKAHATPRVHGGKGLAAATAALGGGGEAVTDLLAESLDVNLGQLFAAHQALDPAVESWDGGGLERGRRCELCGSAPDVLHVGIHGCNWVDGQRAAAMVRRGREGFAAPVVGEHRVAAPPVVATRA